MGKLVNQTELAEIWGKSRKWVGEMRKEGLPHQPSKGRRHEVIFDTEEVWNWLTAREVAKYQVPRESGTDDNLSQAEADRLKTIVDYRRKAILLAYEERRSVPLEVVDRIFSEAAITFRTQSESVGGRICGEVATLSDPGEIRQVILRECRHASSSAAGILRRFLDDQESANATGTAPDAGGVGVGGGEADTPEG